MTSTEMSNVSDQVGIEMTVTLEKPMELGKGTILRVPPQQAASSSRYSPNVPHGTIPVTPKVSTKQSHKLKN